MGKSSNEAIVRRYFDEVWNRGNIDAADDLVDLYFSVEGCGGAISGLEAVKLYVSSYRRVYPQVHFTMLSVVAEGDMVIACWIGRGLMDPGDCQEECTSQGKRTTGMSIYRIANGKIAEAWAGSDQRGLGTIQRLGIRRNS